MSGPKIEALHGDIDAKTLLLQIAERDPKSVCISVVHKDDTSNIYWSGMQFAEAALHDVVQRQAFMPQFIANMRDDDD